MKTLTLNRRKFLNTSAMLAAGTSLPSVGGAQSWIEEDEKRMITDRPTSSFPLRGVYFHDGFAVEPRRHAPLYWDSREWVAQLEWLSHCGMNAVEFATMLENNSYWEQQLPPDGRLSHLPGDHSKKEVLARLRKVKPNGSPPRALPVAPEQWLADLQRSIERMDWAV